MLRVRRLPNGSFTVMSMHAFVRNSVVTLGLVGLGMALSQDAFAAAKKRNDKQLAQACDDDDGEACGQLAKSLLNSDEVTEKKARRAVSLLERGCELKAGAACSRLAAELERGAWIKQDPARSA